MVGCCQCQGLESFFDKKVARRQLKKYRKKGPGKTTRLLIDMLKAEGVDGRTLLDIGGGIGAIQHELLNAGAQRATHVDASRAYIEAAIEESGRQGHDSRIDHRHGDFVQLAPDLDAADIVTLDRAICCYHDMRSLVGLSLERTRRLYGVVFPIDTWWTKAGTAITNLFLALLRKQFRVFIHPTTAVEALITSAGLERRHYRRKGAWQIAVYARPA